MATATSTSTATTTSTGIRKTIERLKSAWAEMDYAQRRLFEIRTGISVIDRDQRADPASTVAELEALYELESPAVRG